MTSLYLFTVEDVFLIRGRGTIPVPGIPEKIWSTHTIKIGDTVKLVKPDGSALTDTIIGMDYPRNNTSTTLNLLLPFDTIPIGTKVLLVSDEKTPA